MSTTEKNAIGVIGGTGLYELDGFDSSAISLDTPFGAPSSDITSISIEGTPVHFLARHGNSHSILPGQVNYRANIWALKKLGCSKILSIGAVGSLRENIHPGEFVLPDQFIDKTSRNGNTFFDSGVAAYLSMANPFCDISRDAIAACLKSKSIKVHSGGTYIVMEGPQLSSRAESELHRSMGGSIIGMTLCPEAKLAREAEIAYCPICLVSDYDCWNQSEEAVTAASAIAVLGSMTQQLKAELPTLLQTLATITPASEIRNALQTALITDLSSLSEETKLVFEPVLGRYYQ